ncbi:MAG: c-type cytochrome [Burkholderiales bacterium]|nr:c-type cytochrome [Burkholderiales bacterium]
MPVSASPSPLSSRVRRRRRIVFAAFAVSLSTLVWAADIEFLSAVDDAPLDVSTAVDGAKPSDTARKFLSTGVNPYAGNADALAAGKELYNEWCQVCHLADGSGRMGPSLIDDEIAYPRITTDVGLFEVIFGGAAGAMQPFSRRVTHDDVLKIMVYVRELQKNAH